jgi:predicted membrane protein
MIKVNTMEKLKNALFVACSIVLMVGGGLLLDQALNLFYNTSSAVTVISWSLFSVFLYIAGAVLMGRCTMRRCTNKDRSHRSYAGIHDGTVCALLLIAAGLFLLGFNTGNLPHEWKSFFFSWQMLLFVIGSVSMCRFHFISGIIIAASGIFFLHSRVAGIYPGDIYESFMSTFWPVLIIALGILLFFAIIFKPKRCGWKCVDERGNEAQNADGKINYRFVFSGTEQVILDPIFRGGSIEATFGGMELDLRRTSLPEGDTFLHVKITLGGVVMTIPDSWEIEIHQKSFAGCVNDSRVKNSDKDKSRKLVIMAKCTLGGIEIK